MTVWANFSWETLEQRGSWYIHFLRLKSRVVKKLFISLCIILVFCLRLHAKEAEQKAVYTVIALPKTWNEVKKTSNENTRDLILNHEFSSGRTELLSITQYKKTPSVQALRLKQKTISDLEKRKCLVEELPIKRAGYKTRMAWLLFACVEKKSSGWILILDNDPKTTTTYTLERPTYPVEYKLRQSYLNFLPDHFIFCSDLNKDCKTRARAKKAEGKKVFVLSSFEFNIP